MLHAGFLLSSQTASGHKEAQNQQADAFTCCFLGQDRAKLSLFPFPSFFSLWGVNLLATMDLLCLDDLTRVRVSPMVHLAILDQYLRQDSSVERVYGMLLGDREMHTLDITSCFAVPVTETEDEVSEPSRAVQKRREGEQG